jgi:hypothetical protein
VTTIPADDRSHSDTGFHSESASIPVDDKDARFNEAVAAVMAARMPNLWAIEKYLSTGVIVATLLLSIGIVGLGTWAAKILWRSSEEAFIKASISREENDPAGFVSRISTNVTNMSKTLNTTFESQVDSATFKILTFGCATTRSADTTGFPPCDATSAKAVQFQALDDQTILLVANPDRQIIHLDLSVYPVDTVSKLEPLYLQVIAEPPPLRATKDGRGRKPLLISPAQLRDKGGDIIQDGYIRLVSDAAGVTEASIDLTPSLKDLHFSGPIELRFAVIHERIPAAGEVLARDQKYEPASGKELFFVRTLTSAFHSIPQVDTLAQQPRTLAAK